MEKFVNNRCLTPLFNNDLRGREHPEIAFWRRDLRGIGSADHGGAQLGRRTPGLSARRLMGYTKGVAHESCLRFDLDLSEALGRRLRPDAMIVQEDRNLVMGGVGILDLDLKDDPRVGKYLMFYHATEHLDPHEHIGICSLGIAWSDDLIYWSWPKKPHWSRK